MNKGTWKTYTKLTVLACSVLMASCGGGGSDSPNTPTPETQTPDNQTPETQVPDSQTPNNPTPDTKTPDTQAPDSQTPDNQTPDNQNPDSQTPDTPEPDNTLLANISGANNAIINTPVQASAKDSTGDTLTYAWSLAVPTGSKATLSATNTQTVSFTPDVTGN